MGAGGLGDNCAETGLPPSGNQFGTLTSSGFGVHNTIFGDVPPMALSSRAGARSRAKRARSTNWVAVKVKHVAARIGRECKSWCVPYYV
jgi:hypothetical protein